MDFKVEFEIKDLKLLLKLKYLIDLKEKKRWSLKWGIEINTNLKKNK